MVNDPGAPPTLSSPSTPPAARSDEQQLVGAGNLEAQEELNNFRRREELRDATHSSKIWVARYLPFIGVGFVLVVVGLVTTHYFLPESRQWLSDGQVRTVERIALYGCLSFLVTHFVRSVT